MVKDGRGVLLTAPKRDFPLIKEDFNVSKLPGRGGGSAAVAWLACGHDWGEGEGEQVNNDIKTRLLRVFVLPE